MQIPQITQIHTQKLSFSYYSHFFSMNARLQSSYCHQFVMSYITYEDTVEQRPYLLVLHSSGKVVNGVGVFAFSFSLVNLVDSPNRSIQGMGLVDL